MSPRKTLGVRNRSSLGNDLEPVLVLDQEPEALTHDGVIVGDDDGDLAAVGPLGARRRRTVGD